MNKPDTVQIQVTPDELLTFIGRLYVENVLLRQRLASFEMPSAPFEADERGREVVGDVAVAHAFSGEVGEVQGQADHDRRNGDSKANRDADGQR